MPVHPIYRVRRRVMAEILLAGGEPRPDQYRRAALEPFDDRVPFAPLDRRDQVPGTADREASRKLPPGPAF